MHRWEVAQTWTFYVVIVICYDAEILKHEDRSDLTIYGWLHKPLMCYK